MLKKAQKEHLQVMLDSHYDMGFDLYGVKAKTKTGEYFRNNVWWWRPLMTYVLDKCEIPDKNKKGWGFNDGVKIPAKTAESIAKQLKGFIKSGNTKLYEENHNKRLAELPLVDCDQCQGTGDRKDLEPLKIYMPPPEWKKKCGSCNGCGGKGKVKQWITNYPFTVENVKKFAQFCEKSGGFTIC